MEFYKIYNWSIRKCCKLIFVNGRSIGYIDKYRNIIVRIFILNLNLSV